MDLTEPLPEAHPNRPENYGRYSHEPHVDMDGTGTTIIPMSQLRRSTTENILLRMELPMERQEVDEEYRRDLEKWGRSYLASPAPPTLKFYFYFLTYAQLYTLCIQQ